jgi:hypothetical protein
MRFFACVVRRDWKPERGVVSSMSDDDDNYDPDKWYGDPKYDDRYEREQQNEPEYVPYPYVPSGLHVVGWEGFLYLFLVVAVVHLLLRWIGL